MRPARGSRSTARPAQIRVLAREPRGDGEDSPEWDDTPQDFGRIAATTARQVILQRLRDVENERTFGDFAGREHDLITGVVSADVRVNAKGVVVVSLGDVEGVIPAAEQAPGETYVHGQRLKCYVVSVVRGMRGPQITLSRTHPGAGPQAVRARGPGDRRRQRRDHRRRPGGRPPVQDRRQGHRARGQPQGCLHRPDGSAGALGDERTERREDRHHRPRSTIPATFVGNALSPARALSVTVVDLAARAARVVVPDYQLSLAIGKEGQNARLAARLTGWRIDIRSDAEPVGGGAPAGAPGR